MRLDLLQTRIATEKRHADLGDLQLHCDPDYKVVNTLRVECIKLFRSSK